MFTDRLDVKLICLVRDNPVLYDLNHPKYMDFNAREVAWQRIGDELKRPAGDCKVRWINIRDVNRRILKKNLTNPRSPHRVYKYEAELAFMKPFYKDVVINDFENDDKSQWDDEEPCDTGGPVDSDDSEKSVKKVSKAGKKSKKRKKRDYDDDEKPLSTLTEQAQANDFDPADPVDAFLMSIGATLKTFSPYHLNLAKSKIFAVVQEHDLQQIVQKTSDVKSTDNMFLE